MPGRADVCGGDLDATELKADGSRSLEHSQPRAGADQVDCFYVYPTVDLGLVAANHTDFADLDPMRFVTLAQAARFRAACNLYVPLYRQTTMGAFILGPDGRRPYREVAESDVVDAFLHYMGQYNRGHMIVLLGHSQGAEMVIALLQRFFDGDPAMRERLLLAMPIGWPIEVESGKTIGGTFTNLPACTRAGETGCVVGYRSYDGAVEAKPGAGKPSAGHESLCVNPSELAHGTDSYSEGVFATQRRGSVSLRGVADVHTPFVVFPHFYAGHCMTGPSGFRYLGVLTPPASGRDRRASPVDMSNPWLHGEMGYHLLDMQLAQGDLIDLVSERAAALGR